MITTKRQYFMTLQQIENAVISQITANQTDYNTLVAALVAASNTILIRFPAQALHYSIIAYQTVTGQWVAQLDLYRGEATPLNHWDMSLLVNMQNNQGTYVVVANTIQTFDYGIPQSSLGTFTPPVTG